MMSDIPKTHEEGAEYGMVVLATIVRQGVSSTRTLWSHAAAHTRGRETRRRRARRESYRAAVSFNTRELSGGGCTTPDLHRGH
jgi:hypothetical protein